MKNLRIAIIGCGNIARIKHATALSKIKEVSLVGFYDANIETARALSADYGSEDAIVYNSEIDLLATSDIDVVHICTPNSTHAQLSIAAMRSGKHVMCEKPMATNIADAQEMLKVSEETGKTLSISYQNRFSDSNRYLKKEVESGRLGDVYVTKAHAIRRRGIPTWGSFLNKEVQGGGALIDIGTHALDLAFYMMDNYEVDSVMGTSYDKFKNQKQTGNAFGDWEAKDYTIDDASFGFIRMKNGATVFLESSWALNITDEGEAKVTLCGSSAGADTRNGLCINGVRHNKLFSEHVGLNDSLEESSLNEARQWVDALLNGTTPEVSAQQALVVSQVLDAIYQSAQSGELVRF